jgi:hypothetical protein
LVPAEAPAMEATQFFQLLHLLAVEVKFLMLVVDLVLVEVIKAAAVLEQPIRVEMETLV